MFKSLAQILNLLIEDIKNRYLADEVYSGESKPKLTKTKYWAGIKALFENSEQNLLCFRSFHFKDSRRAMPAPFSELEGDKLAENKDWAWALVFADMFFLIEKASYYKFFVKFTS